jgi:MFS family permease
MVSTELLPPASTWCIPINTTPGIFQSYYRSDLLVGYAPSAISWIGTITSFFLCASPLMWGPIFDRGSVRILVFVGSGAVVFGLMMTSLCTTYWHLILAQGIVVGLGGGCTFLTATSILPTYFAKKRSLVMGIAASGSSMGGIIYPIVFHQLNGRSGFLGLFALSALSHLLPSPFLVQLSSLASPNRP